MIHIVSDTSTMYTPEQGKQIGTTIVPLHVTINDRSYRDLEDISDDMLLEMIADKHVPKTSQPSLGEKIDAYDELSSTGEVLDIAMSSGLSGTYQSALLAKDQCANPDRVHVFDSRTLCGPHRIMLDVAVSMAKQGQITGVGIAHRGETEYLKSIPNGSENDNLGNLPSVSPQSKA